MFEFINNDDRGQVGIGTLIVFIAMVLVAAIAAGVLINTAGFLQSQAEATGEESTELVSERIEVTSTVGIVSETEDFDGDDGADRGELEAIRVGVDGAPGADGIDLNSTVIQVNGPEGTDNLVMADPGEDDIDGDDTADASQIEQGFFAVEDDSGNFADPSDAVIEDDNDDFTIVINPKMEPFGEFTAVPADYTADTELNDNDVFGESDEASLDIVSPASATTSVELRSPDLYSEAGEAVRL